MGKKLDNAIAILNGTIGNHLTRTRNGLAIEMSFVKDGDALPLDHLRAAYPDASSRVVILVHGLMATESLWHFPLPQTGQQVDRDELEQDLGGQDYGSLLARDYGFTPLYVRYNSGRAIADNGADLAVLLEALVDAYPKPIDELLFIGHSMGGLVIRSACHEATIRNHRWLAKVRRAIYVGTPHRGAPAERLGRVVTKLLSTIDDPYTRLIADIAELRSDGIKDLGDADLRHEDRAARKPHFGLRDASHPVPLLPAIRHYLIAGSLSFHLMLASMFGDAIVPVPSATDGSCTNRDTLSFPPGHIKLLRGVGHVPLAHHPDVYEYIRVFCNEDP